MLYRCTFPTSFLVSAALAWVSLNCVSGRHTAHLDEQTTAQSRHQTETTPAGSVPETVKGFMQTRPGGPMEEVEVRVHEVPVDLPLIDADKAPLHDDDLVLGVADNEHQVAYPIRYLAMSEVVDGYVGETPVAATW